MDEGSRKSGRRVQVRLWDLVVVVVGSSYVLDVTRRSRNAWGGGMPDQAHALALMVLTLGVGLCLLMMGQGVRQLRGRDREGWAWATTWRVVVVGVLIWSVAEVAATLQIERAELTGNTVTSTQATMRLNAIPLVATLGLIGLILAVSPIRRPRASGAKPGWKSWPLVLLLTLASVMIVAKGHGVIPYLVLLAMEAVHNAMNRAPLVSRPIVFDRLTLAGLEALPGLVGCFLTAIWLDDDLRAATSDPLAARAPRSMLGVLGRASTVALAAGGAASVVLGSIPRLSVPLAEGIAFVFEPSTTTTIVLGFSALAAGIAARSAAHLTAGAEPATPPGAQVRGFGPWPRRIIKVMVGLVAIEITVAAVQVIRGDIEDRWYIPITLETWKSIIHGPAQWLGFTKGSTIDPLDLLLYQPCVVLIAVAAIWMVYWMTWLFLSKTSDQPAPLDAIASDRLALGRFFGWWIGLTTLMLASLPILAVTGVTLTHYLILWGVK